MNIILEKLKKLNIDEKYIEFYGDNIAKINWKYIENIKIKGKLILVSSITPTPYGEGKTTVSIGLNDTLRKENKKSIVVLREPSMGPYFGIKGGATGGGKCLVRPEEKINLHFTGDIHAITTAHNLIVSIIEQSLFFNIIDIDPNKIFFKRCIDMNDRHLRNIKISINDKISYNTGFQITASSEIMSIICLARNMKELITMIENIVVAQNTKGENITVKDLQITNSLIKILNDAFSPNIVLTGYNNLAIIHGGPFANIAHGCNSILATKLGLATNDIVITEAGFGSDLGAEKFLNIKSKKLGKNPDLILLVITLKALIYHGEIYDSKNPINYGIKNLIKHIKNLKLFKIPILVTLNYYIDDDMEKIKIIENVCKNENVDFEINYFYHKGENGSKTITKKIENLINKKNSQFQTSYNEDDDIITKINKIVKKLYGAQKIEFSDTFMNKLNNLKEKINYPICIAKTPNSFTQNSKDRGVPKEFTAKIRDFKISYGSKMVIVYMGNIIDMPGLPKTPLAKNL